MATATRYSVPTSPYDYIHSNNNLNQNYQVPNDGTFGMGTAEPFYTPSLNEVQTHTCPYPLNYPNNVSYFKSPQVRVTYNGGLPPTSQPYNVVPHSQAQPSFTTAPGPTAGSSTALQGATAFSPASLGKRVKKAKLKLKETGKRTRNVSAKELLTGNRKRAPKKRPPGKSLSELLDGLPHEVRNALEEEYIGCCESVNIKGKSTRQKHWFTNRHCLNLPKEYQEAIPNFVCPAFLAFNSKCRSKAGRYDSTERHCQNCAGFQEISSGRDEAFPVEITRQGYRDVQIIRTALADAENKGKGEVTKQAMDSVRRMLAALFEDGLPEINYEEDESNGSGAIMNHTVQPTDPPPPTTSESGPVFEPEWDFDTLQMTNYESNVPGGIVYHTAPPPTTSEPVVELESADASGWDFDALLASSISKSHSSALFGSTMGSNMMSGGAA